MSYFRRNTKKVVSKRDFTQSINDLDNELESEIKQNDEQTNDIEMTKIQVRELEHRIDTLELKDTNITGLAARVSVVENILNNLIKIT
tara:strand:- start:263 stop:526 length:264 start_codon:yes stop_codon:yes gene_type:complete